MQTYSEFIKRFQKLAGIKTSYAIEVVFHISVSELIFEHETYQKFQNTHNRYSQHPERPEFKIKRHYHVYPSNSKKEIYAVNMDGKAHHKKNRGFEVPKKEAEELRKLGVKIPDNRILEHKEVFINENLESYFSIFLIINE
jgi:hypothetical protein